MLWIDVLIHVHAVHTVIPYGGHDVSVHVVGDAAKGGRLQLFQ